MRVSSILNDYKFDYSPTFCCYKAYFNAFLNSWFTVVLIKLSLFVGGRWLVHKGAGYGVSSQTIVEPAGNMGKGWNGVESKKVTGAKIADYVKTGGKKYKVVTDNCHHASHRMFHKIKG
jgi:hypothetical protein